MELPIPELNDWKGASDFVADHLIYVPLTPPYELVRSDNVDNVTVIILITMVILDKWIFVKVNMNYWGYNIITLKKIVLINKLH